MELIFARKSMGVAERFLSALDKTYLHVHLYLHDNSLKLFNYMYVRAPDTYADTYFDKLETQRERKRFMEFRKCQGGGGWLMHNSPGVERDSHSTYLLS
jgi:hypothetical protein